MPVPDVPALIVSVSVLALPIVVLALLVKLPVVVRVESAVMAEVMLPPVMVRSPARVTLPASLTENLEVGETPDKRSINLKPVLALATVPVISEPVVSWALLTLKKLVLVVLPVRFTCPVPSGAIVIEPLVPVSVTTDKAWPLMAKVPELE